MKTLEINKLYYPVIGGIETVVKEIAEGLNGRDNLHVDVLACQKKGKRQEEIINGIRVYKAASFGKVLGMPLSFDFFRLFFKIKNNYDLIILHYPFPLAAFLAPFIPKDQLIIYYHSDIIRQKFLSHLLFPVISVSLRRAKKILVSGINIVNYSSILNKFKSKCEVIPYGIDFDLKAEDYNAASKIKARYFGQPLLLSIGRLVYYKGFEYVVRSMVDVEATLLIIGEGPLKNGLIRLINELNLQNKVFIISPQPRLTAFLLASDIFIFPSIERSEAFGLVQLEAMAAGLPVINTYLHTTVEEVSLNEVSGLTVKAKNSKALAEAINKLLNQEQLRIDYGTNARQRYLRLFTKDVYLKKLKKLL